MCPKYSHPFNKPQRISLGFYLMQQHILANGLDATQKRLSVTWKEKDAFVILTCLWPQEAAGPVQSKRIHTCPWKSVFCRTAFQCTYSCKPCCFGSLSCWRMTLLSSLKSFCCILQVFLQDHPKFTPNRLVIKSDQLPCTPTP